MDAVELMKKEMLRRKYSLMTIENYVNCLRKFLNYCKNEPRKITKMNVKDYLNGLAEKKVSGSTINVNLNALKFLMEEILNKNFMVKIRYSKVPKELPTVLSKGEIVKLINCIDNDKHKLMIKLMYSAGLRVSELINLKVEDLELDNCFGWVRHGKGNKDRMFIIADSLREELTNHIRKNNLGFDSFLFSGYNGKMSVRTLQVIVKRAAKKAKIYKNVHCHTLRHSYATHLIENGYGVASVQSLLGHNSMETTMVYVHIASPRMINVKSPLDSLSLGNHGLQLQKEDRKLSYEYSKTEELGCKSEKYE